MITLDEIRRGSVLVPGAPSSDDLARDFSIVVTDRFPGPMGPITIGYLARVGDLRVGPALIELRDAFDYQCTPAVVKTENGPRLEHRRSIKPCDGFDLGSIYVDVRAVLPLRDVGPKILDELRAKLVEAWNGREHLRKHGGRVIVPESPSL